MFEIAKLHYITQDHVEGYDHASLAKEACEGGTDWVQLRVKNRPYTQTKAEAIKVLAVCHAFGAKFIINDHVELVKEIQADGVHLGKTDMAPQKARKILGSGSIIGGTANSIEDIEYLVDAAVDYIGIGPYRFTATKENLSPILGIEGLRSAVEWCKKMNINIPLIAIGGIRPDDIQPILDTGIYGVAVSSFINKATNISTAAKTVLETINNQFKD